MNVKSDELEQVLEYHGVPEKTYGVLVTNVGHGHQISVEVAARSDVTAATTARYVYYSNFGRPMTAIHCRCEVIEDAVSDNGVLYFPAEHFRMGV